MTSRGSLRGSSFNRAALLLDCGREYHHIRALVLAIAAHNCLLFSIN
jgi:hypothetical protein